MDPDILYVKKNVIHNCPHKSSILLDMTIEQTRLYVYFMDYRIWSKDAYRARKHIMRYVIGHKRPDLFQRYIESHPDPFTKEEIVDYMAYDFLLMRSLGGIPFKYTEYLVQKLKELMG
jgi:hypothetical protein